VIHNILALFATTEVFIYVFMEIVVHIESIRRVLSRTASRYDTIFCMSIFGAFSIFGTYTGIELPGGAISSIRDLGPLVAGLVAGPVVGLGAGLIGGIQRYFIGGFTAVPCGMATVLAGLIGGIVYLINKKKVVGIFYAILAAVFVEIMHGALALLIARPFDDALEVVITAIPAMMVANGMGAAISIIVLEHALKELETVRKAEEQKNP
jgi:sigma-B regulation protein RsbU (phosphoserine phosphatase)